MRVLSLALFLGACGMTEPRNPASEERSAASARAAKLKLQRACGSQETFERLKVLAFREAAAGYPTMPGDFSLHLYARDGDRLRARMFAPLSGIPEDPATGSANAALAALLLHLAPNLDRAGFEVAQGAEMDRPSQLRASAWRIGQEVRAGVGGGAVPVLRGSVDL